MPYLTPVRSSVLRPALAPITARLWGLDALSGRLCELSAVQSSVVLTLAMGLVLDAQLAGETTAWVTTTHSAFFAPDAAALGVDLRSLVVIRAGQREALGRAADHLARSGGFGLIVIDLASGDDLNRTHIDATLGMPLQSRLLGLAQKHHTALVFLSHKPAEEPSLSSLVSLRGHVQRRTHGPHEQGRFAYEMIAIKDKRRAPGWSHVEVVDGPPGLF